MADIDADNELNHWFSTYGVITAERILGRYNIIIPSDSLINAVKNSTSFYHRLLKVPIKNVLNGIILQQANDYHIYAQKLFIDYLLSGESGKSEEFQGALTRESLENERQQLVSLGDRFHQLQVGHNELISTSQASLIKVTREWQATLELTVHAVHAVLVKYSVEQKKSDVRKGINHALIFTDLIQGESSNNRAMFINKLNEVVKFNLNEDLRNDLLKSLGDLMNLTALSDAVLVDFSDKASEVREQAQSFRTQFYDTILRVMELIKLLPEYKINPDQDAANREPLYFDKSLGTS